jgi:hypothetical protein
MFNNNSLNLELLLSKLKSSKDVFVVTDAAVVNGVVLCGDCVVSSVNFARGAWVASSGGLDASLVASSKGRERKLANLLVAFVSSSARLPLEELVPDVVLV